MGEVDEGRGRLEAATLRLAILSLLLSSAALAQNIESAPMVKNPPAPDKGSITLLVTVYPNAVYTCPKGFTMFLRNVKPKESHGVPESNFMIFFPAPDGQIITSSAEGREYKGVCLKGWQ